MEKEEKKIGKNNISEVELRNIDGKKTVLKKIDLKKIENSDEKKEILNDLKAECQLLKVDRENFLKIIDFRYDENNEIFEISMEFMKSNLREYIEANGKLSSENFLVLLKNIVTGLFFFLDYFHANMVIFM